MTHVTDGTISDNDTSATLNIDDLIDRVQPVPGTIKRHVSRAAVYELLILQHAVIRHNGV